LAPGDVLVLNDSRVLPARLELRKRTGARAEVLLLEPLDHGEPLDHSEDPAGPRRWRALVRPGRRLPPGTALCAPEAPRLLVTVGERLADGCRAVDVFGDPWTHGRLALPPYIHAPLADPQRYQTVYARRPGSVAAPTAGLHLTPAVLDACRRGGVTIAALELSVGLDTFRPVTAKDPADHVIHSEAYRVPEPTWSACTDAARRGGRVIAVGTTTVRALETVAQTGQLTGRTGLYIHGAYPFAIVDALLTNFHLPRSSLLLLVEAFYGPGWRSLYATALAEGYRFLSFGDAMLLPRHAVAG
jgi:S-adenosylmethionine:tRNA ribosyltransferase-isomerase